MTAARVAIACVVGLAVPVVLAYSGLTVWLGAHPWWSQSTAWIGGTIGLAASLLFLGMRLPRTVGGIVGTIALLAGAWAAHAGKTAFADSFAEDALAGRFWYWGWIGGLAGLTLVITALLLPRRITRTIPTGTPDHA